MRLVEMHVLRKGPPRNGLDPRLDLIEFPSKTYPPRVGLKWIWLCWLKLCLRCTSRYTCNRNVRRSVFEAFIEGFSGKFLLISHGPPCGDTSGDIFKVNLHQ